MPSQNATPPSAKPDPSDQAGLHVALVMDGNGRWAKRRGLPRTVGHQAGVEALKRIVQACPDLGIRWLTVFGFSTENWSRPVAEVAELMALPQRYFRSDLPRLEREGVPLPEPFPEGWSDPARLEAFLAGASGLTVIQPRLEEILPPAVPKLVLEPGVDFELFGTPLSAVRRATVRRAAGAAPDAALVVYTGNIHDSNVDEMRALYEALALLRARGRKVVLARTGSDHVLGVDYLQAAAQPGSGVTSLGQVDRPFLVELLKAADLFIQPGRPGPFNDYRLPSKLPEFMAVGRPVILPRTNIGLHLTHGEDALLLEEGSAAEIAARAEQVLDDPALARRLSAGAQAFARRRWRWDRQAAKLSAFLAQVA